MFTALLIVILIVAGATTVIGSGLILAASRRRQLQGQGQQPKALPGIVGGERGFEDIRVGDIVQRGEVDYLVEGTLHFDEAGHRWVAASLDDGSNLRWLYVGVEKMGSSSLRFLELDDGLEISGFPPQSLVAGDTRYELDKRGTASAKRRGDVGGIPGADSLGPDSVFRCRWWRYEAAGNKTLLIEEWGGVFRVLRGAELDAGELELMPGS